MFLNRPELIYTGKICRGRPVYRLGEALLFRSRLNGHGIVVRVPAGFETDLASSPWPVRWIFPPAGPWLPAAILHDYLYTAEGVSRFLADALFREAMAQLGVPVLWRVVAYYCVRLFGGSHVVPKKGRRYPNDETIMA